METEFVGTLEERTARRPLRALTIEAIGPLTMLAGVIWAIAQPYRLTILHPHGQGFWWLLVEPPIWVVLVGVLFAWRIAPGLLEDLSAAEG